MKPTFKQVGLVRLSSLMPVIGGVILLFLALIPHLFYQAGSDVYTTLSLFELMDNTYQSCMGFFNGSTAGTTADLYFHFVMFAVWAVSLLCIVFYGLFVLATALMVSFVWTPHPQPHPTVNQLKRAYRILVPNRGFYVFFHVLPVLPSVYPYLLQLFSRTMLGQEMHAHYYGIPDFIIVILLSAASVTLFFVTLSAQRENKMDLFRIYKVEK